MVCAIHEQVNAVGCHFKGFTMLVSLSALSQSDLWLLEATWDKARAEAQDEGRQYLSIACKGNFNI